MTLLSRLQDAPVGTREQPREPLPTKAQIDAISDVPSLETMREEIEQRIARIETDLDFREGSDDWENRARAALSHHRYASGLIWRRIRALQPAKARKAGAAPLSRERTSCDPLTWKLLCGEVATGPTETVAQIDAAMADLSEALIALDADRRDEAIRPVRDHDWLAHATEVQRQTKATRHALSIKKAALHKAAKEKARREADEARERLFIQAAKDLLPAATYRLLWDRVDRQQMDEAA